MIYQLLAANNDVLAVGTFGEMTELEASKRAFGEFGMVIAKEQCELEEEQYCSAYALYKSDGAYGYLHNSEAAMLGFVAALAEYPDQWRTIEQAIDYYAHLANKHKLLRETRKDNSRLVKSLVDYAKAFREKQSEWVRWPSLPLS